MTNEEAIAILDTIPTISEQVDALEMAIEALEERKTSKWNLTEIHNCYEVYQCAECERKITVFHRFGDMSTIAKVTEDYPYCHCGAKMEVDE